MTAADLERYVYQDDAPLSDPPGVHHRRVPRYDLAAGIPICGFTGVNGAGKTLLAVQSAICDMARGRTVYSTVPIASMWGRSLPIRSMRELLEIRDATVLLDEISVMFSSRASASLPGEFVTFLQVLRHHGITVRWTAPAWSRAELLVREVTQGLINVAPLGRRANGTPWPTPRLVMAAMLDTSQGKVDEQPTVVRRRRIAVPRRLDAWGAYDTLADVRMFTGRSVSGRCPDCGGTREVPKCSAGRHDVLGMPFFSQL